MKNKPLSVKPDVWIFLITIPFISAFNYYLTYNLKWGWYLLFTFVIDTLQGYLAWWIVRTIILYLDTKIPYFPHFFKRISLQIVLTFLAGLGFIALTTEILSWLIRGKSANWSFYTTDLFIISIWFWVINGVYIGIYFFEQWKQLQEERKQEAFKAQTAGFLVRIGNQSLLVPAHTILCFFVENDYVRMIDQDLKKYLLDLSLDKIEKQVSANDFFRLNRQTIVHKKALIGFKRLENGKLLAQINLPLETEIELTISRTKAPQFRTWFLPQ